MSHEYKLAIPKDIPAMNRQNICDFMNQNNLYKARLDSDYLILENVIWPDFYQLNSSINKITNKSSLQKIADEAFAWGPELTVDTNVLKVINEDRIRLESLDLKREIIEFIFLIKRILSLSGKTALTDSLEIIQKCFFNRFPEGEILFIKKPALFACLERASSMFSGLCFLSKDDLQQLFAKNRGVFNTFQKGHFLIARDFLAPGLYDLETGSYGFSSHWISHHFIFLFGRREHFHSKEMRAKLQSAQGIDTLSEMWSDSTQEIPEIRALTASEAKESFLWHLKGINKSMSFLLNSTNFRGKKSGDLMVKDQFYALMTFDAMQETLLRCHTAGNNLIRKLLFFDFIDRYIGLLGITDTSHVFSIVWFKKHVLDRYVNLSSGLKQFITKTAKGDYARLFGKTLEGIYQKGRHKGGYVQMGRDGGNRVSSQSYFQFFMVNLRDTTHGYPLKEGKFTNFFAIHTGSISHLLPRLATYLFHGIISDPVYSLEKRFKNLKEDL